MSLLAAVQACNQPVAQTRADQLLMLLIVAICAMALIICITLALSNILGK